VAAVAAPVAEVLLVEFELRGGFRGWVRPASGAMSSTARSLLGYAFMPRLADLKDQQLCRLVRGGALAGASPRSTCQGRARTNRSGGG
jgi:hypothetical protein